MSWEVVGDNENLGQFASNSGYADLIRAGKGNAALEDLFKNNESADVPAVIEGLNAITGTDDVTSTAKGLAEMIASESSILITDGLTGDGGVGDVPEEPDMDALRGPVKDAIAAAMTPKVRRKIRKLVRSR